MTTASMGLSRRRVVAGLIGAGGLGALMACGPDVETMSNGRFATNVARDAAADAMVARQATPASVAAANGGNGGHGSMSVAPAAAAPARDWAAMDAEHERGVKFFLAQGKTARGGQRMAPALEDGVKVFRLTAKAMKWETMPGEVLDAFAYNGAVPGPEIRVTEGDKVRVILRNELDESTAIHFHGLLIPNKMDGVPFITQPPIRPGETFTYEFVARNPGSHMYHSHMNAAFQVTKGLLGAFIIEPKDKAKYPAHDREYTMILNDGPLGYTINGKGFPATEVLTAKRGEKLLVRYMNEGLMIHPMHLHGMPMTVIAQDGYACPQPYLCDTVNIAPGQRIDAIVECTEEGAWAFHCHILSHAESEHGMFGMVTALVVE